MNSDSYFILALCAGMAAYIFYASRKQHQLLKSLVKKGLINSDSHAYAAWNRNPGVTFSSFSVKSMVVFESSHIVYYQKGRRAIKIHYGEIAKVTYVLFGGYNFAEPNTFYLERKDGSTFTLCTALKIDTATQAKTASILAILPFIGRRFGAGTAGISGAAATTAMQIEAGRQVIEEFASRNIPILRNEVVRQQQKESMVSVVKIGALVALASLIIGVPAIVFFEKQNTLDEQRTQREQSLQAKKDSLNFQPLDIDDSNDRVNQLSENVLHDSTDQPEGVRGEIVMLYGFKAGSFSSVEISQSKNVLLADSVYHCGENKISDMPFTGSSLCQSHQTAGGNKVYEYSPATSNNDQFFYYIKSGTLVVLQTLTTKPVTDEELDYIVDSLVPSTYEQFNFR